jgi:hypothetical protein
MEGSWAAPDQQDADVLQVMMVTLWAVITFAHFGTVALLGRVPGWHHDSSVMSKPCYGDLREHSFPAL